MSFPRSCKTLESTGSAAPLIVSTVDDKVIDQRYAKLLRQRQDEAKRVGQNVSPFAQELFDHLSKTLACVWKGQSIDVNGLVLIAPPYSASDCTSDNARALSRVQLLVR